MVPEKLLVSIDDPFVPSMSTMEVWEALQSKKPTVRLPEIRVALNDIVVYDRQLVMSGSPKSHLWFGYFEARAAGSKARFHVTVPGAGLDAEVEIDLSKGRYLYLCRGFNGTVVFEQSVEPRQYK
jgi:hypothetical protein